MISTLFKIIKTFTYSKVISYIINNKALYSAHCKYELSNNRIHTMQTKWNVNNMVQITTVIKMTTI